MLKENVTSDKQTYVDHEFGRSIIANIQEANYKNCHNHFPLNSHNNKNSHC